MRRDTFLKSMAALAVAGTLPLSARAGANIKMMIPANPGGGWDATGRALGKALQDAKVADSVALAFRIMWQRWCAGEAPQPIILPRFEA